MIHEKIAELRKSLGLSQADFGTQVGISAGSINKYESGKTKPSQKMLDKIIAVYGSEWLPEESQAAPQEGAGSSKEEILAAVEAAMPAPEEPVEIPAQEADTAAEEAGAKQPAPKKRSRKKKDAAEVVDDTPVEAAPAVNAAEAPASVAEKPARRNRKPAKKEAEEEVKAAPVTAEAVVIQSAMGGSITIDEILNRVRKIAPDASAVYVKTEENNAYWVQGKKTGAVTLW